MRIGLLGVVQPLMVVEILVTEWRRAKLLKTHLQIQGLLIAERLLRIPLLVLPTLLTISESPGSVRLKAWFLLAQCLLLLRPLTMLKSHGIVRLKTPLRPILLLVQLSPLLPIRLFIQLQLLTVFNSVCTVWL